MNEEQKELARKILDQVERQPETLYMGAWELSYNDSLHNWKTDESVEGCGTTRCIAGWAVHLAARDGEEPRDTRWRIAHENGLLSAAYESVGAHLLGLGVRDARSLFLEMDEEEAVAFLRQQAGLE